MINIKGALFQWCINFLIKKTSGGAVKNEIMKNKEMAAELTHKNTKRALMQTIFGVLIQLICNY